MIFALVKIIELREQHHWKQIHHQHHWQFHQKRHQQHQTDNYWWFTRYPLLTRSSCYFAPAASLVLQSIPSLRWTMSPESEQWIWILSKIHHYCWQSFRCSMLLKCWCNLIYFSILVIPLVIITITLSSSSSSFIGKYCKPRRRK